MTTYVGKKIKRINGKEFSTGNMEETVVNEVVSPVNGKMRLYITETKFINEEYAKLVGQIIKPEPKPKTYPKKEDWESALI